MLRAGEDLDNIAVIGAGVIGGAIVKSLLKKGYEGKVIATRRDLEKLRELKALGAEVTINNKEAAKESDIIFLCVKPNDIEKVLREISDEIKGKIIVSTAATIPLNFYKEVVPHAKFVRTMPNIAALVQEAYIAYCCDESISPDDKKKVEELLSIMGIPQEVEEKYMDAITALSGSGPAYVSIIIEALMYAGLRVGLPRNIALYSAAQTVLGTGKLILETQEHPAKVKDMVTTPGGTTIEAIYELEGSQIRQALMRAIKEATDKCQRIRNELIKDVG
ncbi:MAG: pyrroline-5-carboxylate reductase [Candidatus Bathyarchaeota archaeon]|nr:pyrroline-5-carboxylate reductase [Candidatus Bathyarchaeota archaeon]MDW8041068.1 pyrroline-5-carboxylate reductase [Nitrososphaerota archaeon]